jgi:hypothetical protein
MQQQQQHYHPVCAHVFGGKGKAMAVLLRRNDRRRIAAHMKQLGPAAAGSSSNCSVVRTWFKSPLSRTELLRAGMYWSMRIRCAAPSALPQCIPEHWLYTPKHLV